MSKASAANAADGSSTRLSVRSKTFYGIGSVAFGVSTLGLSSAVLQPYLNRVIGLPALWVGTARVHQGMKFRRTKKSGREGRFFHAVCVAASGCQAGTLLFAA